MREVGEAHNIFKEGEFGEDGGWNFETSGENEVIEEFKFGRGE
jgi:hypothetical protein